MEKIFLPIYQFFSKRRGLLFILFASCILLFAFFASKLKFEEDISKILPRDKKIEKLNQVFQHSKFIDKLIVMVSLKDTLAREPDSLVSYADNFAAAITGKSLPYINKVSARVDDSLSMELFSTITDRLPVYLNENDYRSIDSLINPEQIRKTLEQDIKILSSPAGMVLKNTISNDPVGITFIGLRKLQQLQYDENFELYDNYVVTKDHKNLLIFITPRYPPNNTGKNALLLEGLDSVIEMEGKKNPSFSTAYFGATAVSVGNALQLRQDSIFTQGITVLFIIIFLAFYFKKKRAPFLILIPVVFGALFSLAAIYFIKGSISVIALGTGSVVLGIAVNYSLHFFNHYLHTKSMEETLKDLSMPMTIGSLTTIGGFLCLQFVESEMLKDLGLFAAFSLIGASLCSLIFLPHFIIPAKQPVRESNLSWLDKMAAYRPEYNKYLILLIIALTVVFGYYTKNVRFESDMMRMNYMGEKLRYAEAKLNRINEFALQSVYLVTEGKTVDEALVNNEKLVDDIEMLKEKNIVKKYSGVSSLIISDSLQKKRIERWNQYWTAEKKQQLLATLQREGAVLGFRSTAFDNFKNLLDKNYQPAGKDEIALLRKNFLDDYITEKEGRATVVTLVKLSAESKPEIYKAFENRDEITVVDKQYLTGKFVDIINADFSRIALMSSLLVFTVLLITYGRIELTLVSFIPMAISWVWILGIMGMLGITFNIINIIISALIFGLGDDYSLFIMDGLLREYKTGKKNLTSYKSSIFLSAITTITGLGVLIFAKHPALKSIAIISIIGILCVVVMSQILIPFFFNLLIKNRTDKKLFPWTFFGFLKSAFASCFFIFGAAMMIPFGLILVKFNPFNKEKGKLIFHTLICKFSKSLIYMMWNAKKTIINPHQEDFSTPAVIVCNHQSGIDNFLLMMLHPKLILFTNDRVWNAPVSGIVVQMADYYSTANGVEHSLSLLEDRVKNGYSIVVFAEGTRSPDGNVQRFHKGAFFLAEKLNLDILPIVLHGSGYTLSKNDTLVKDGNITIKFLPRISQTDASFGTGYSERGKNIGRYFKREYNQLRAEKEQPAYFREQLIYNYIYKGPVLEWYMKVKTRLEKNYEPFHELLPREGKLLDIGCGYGFMSYMLHFAAPGRHITGIDYDEEKTETANNCFSKDANISFRFADVMNFAFEEYDGIIMADMLHYLEPLQQRDAIEKCIRHLNPGGTLIIRDGNKDLEEKHKGTRLTEFFSTKLIGFNKTTGKGLSFLSGSLIRDIAAVHQLECKEIDQTKYTSNMMFIIKKPASDKS